MNSNALTARAMRCKITFFYVYIYVISEGSLERVSNAGCTDESPPDRLWFMLSNELQPLSVADTRDLIRRYVVRGPVRVDDGFIRPLVFVYSETSMKDPDSRNERLLNWWPRARC